MLRMPTSFFMLRPSKSYGSRDIVIMMISMTDKRIIKKNKVKIMDIFLQL